jgi:hypothetical protein
MNMAFIVRAGLRNVGAPETLTIPFKAIFPKYFFNVYLLRVVIF